MPFAAFFSECLFDEECFASSLPFEFPSVLRLWELQESCRNLLGLQYNTIVRRERPKQATTTLRTL
jgi:hypothetical protein